MDLDPSDEQLRAAEYDNVFPRCQRYPITKHAHYITTKLFTVLAISYYLLTPRGGTALRHVTFTTVLTTLLALPFIALYTAWTYITTGSFPTLTGTEATIATHPVTSELLTTIIHVISATPPPVLIGVDRFGHPGVLGEL